VKSKLLTALIIACAAGLLTSPLTAEVEATHAFEQLKRLVGQWEGKREDGSTATASYRLSGNDSFLIEEFDVVEHDGYDMSTMYHLDGDRLMLTHYCMAKNQPRMTADLSSSNLETINFTFLDATNLKSAADGHMHSAVFNFLDEQSMEQAWTFRKDGVDSFSEVIRFERVN
jgi:hypothetical protein